MKTPFSLLCLLLLLLPGAVWAAILPDGLYRVSVAESEMTVTAAGRGTGARVCIQKNDSAVWKLRHRGNDIYELWLDGKVLDSKESKVFNGVHIIIWPRHGEGNQQWKITRAGAHYRLTCVWTKLALDLKDNRRENGNTLQGHTPTSSTGQLFDLTPIKADAPQKKETPQKPAFIGH